MLSGALIKLPDDLQIESLDGARWDREDNGEQLKSVIQFQNQRVVVDRDTTAELALAIHEEIKKEPILIEEEPERYSILYQDAVKTRWAHIYIFHGLTVVDRLENRDFVRQIINKGLHLTNPAHLIYLNTAMIAREHVDHWIRGFSDRSGRVDRGMVYGEGVEQDSVFGPELERSTKRSVGWVTHSLGSPAKVRVSPLGSVTVWANPRPELFLRFLKTEILPYIIALP